MAGNVGEPAVKSIEGHDWMLLQWQENRATVEETPITSQGKVWYGKSTVDTKVRYFSYLAACDLHLRPSIATSAKCTFSYKHICPEEGQTAPYNGRAQAAPDRTKPTLISLY